MLLSGTIGNHGATVMLARGDVDPQADTLRSDTMALNGLIRALLDQGIGVHFMRDATRGGVATLLNEIAQQTGLAVAIDEDALPVHDVVRGVDEILGIDPLYIANEGKLVAMVAVEDVGRALALMRSRPEGGEAAIIGEVRAEPEATVGHPHRVRGHPRRRHAHRRPTVTHLLTQAKTKPLGGATVLDEKETQLPGETNLEEEAARRGIPHQTPVAFIPEILRTPDV